MTIKNNEGKTPLDVCGGTNKYEIISLFLQYSPKQGKVLNNNYVVFLYFDFLLFTNI